jgi:hypothetical protein
MARNIRQHLADLSGASVRGLDYRKLASAFGKDVQTRAAEDLRNEAAREHAIDLHDRHLDWMKRAIAEAIEQESAEISGTLPVISAFEAAQMAKNASKKYSRDVGVLNLSALLERKWKADREAHLTSSDVIMLKDHYNKNFPKSAAREVIENFTREGYLDLPVGKLIDIAAQIRNQDDFDYYIKEAGLHTNNPYNQKARKFILALLNGDQEKTAQNMYTEGSVADYIWGELSLFDEWWETDAGSHYWSDFEMHVNAWIDTIEEAAKWAEESGTGDTSQVDYPAHIAELSDILFKIGPEGVSKDDFKFQLEDLQNEAIDIAFENRG